MEILENLIVQAAQLSSPLALVGILVCGTIIVTFRDKRMLLITFLLLVVIASLFFTQLVPPRLALVKLVAGLFVCAIYGITMQQVRWRPTRWMEADTLIEPATMQMPALKVGDLQLPELEKNITPAPERGSTISGLLFRALAAILIALFAYQIAINGDLPLPNLAPPILLASFFLMGMGILIVGLTEEAIKTGMGIFAILLGFQIVYTAVEPSLAIFAFLAVLDLMLALSVSYLAVVRSNKIQ